jgi:JAB1/Mov34/MPN/PAD-1 ubiquitin protease
VPLHRNVNQKRVIGTMLGVRSDDGAEVEIRNCFAVPHNESSEQVVTGEMEWKLIYWCRLRLIWSIISSC